MVGQGYVGLPLAMRAVEVGHSVIGYEVDEKRVGLLAAGLSFVGDVSDYAAIVRWSYSACRNRLVLWFTKRTSALASDLETARVSGRLYFEAERE